MNIILTLQKYNRSKSSFLTFCAGYRWQNNDVITHIVCNDVIIFVSGQLPRRTIPHRTGLGPDEWFYSVVVVLVGSCPCGE